jgi:hypothetical protein
LRQARARYALIVDLDPEQDAAGAVVPVLIELAHTENFMAVLSTPAAKSRRRSAA